MLNVDFRSYSSVGQTHAHSFAQVVLPSRGTLELEIAGCGGWVDQDRAAIIGSGEHHAFAGIGMNRFLVLDVAVNPEVPARTIDLLDKLSTRRFLALTPAAQHLIGYAEQALVPRGLSAAEEDSRRVLWLELLLHALESQSDLAHDDPVWPLRRAMALIDRFYDQRLKVKDIARRVGLGSSRLHELFQDHLGTTPHGYLAEVRRRWALTLLAGTRLSIAEIAARTGHADQSTLTRHLRRACGVTPAAYRQACRASAAPDGESAQTPGQNAKTRR